MVGGLWGLMLAQVWMGGCGGLSRMTLVRTLAAMVGQKVKDHR